MRPNATTFNGQIATVEFFNATERFQHLQIVVPVLSHFLILLSILPRDTLVAQGIEPHPGPSDSEAYDIDDLDSLSEYACTIDDFSGDESGSEHNYNTEVFDAIHAARTSKEDADESYFQKTQQ